MSDSAVSFLGGHRDPLSPPLLEDGTAVDEWRVTAFLGRGGSGEVYRVESDGRTGALKMLSRKTESARMRFLRESEILSKVDNPAFPRFFSKGELDGRPYVVMELLEPRVLPSSDAEVADLVLGICEGVSVLHSMGYVHRDLKPQNIMCRPGAATAVRPVLIDLGLVKDTSRDEDSAGTALSIVDGRAVGVGTPGYAAPEQLVGDAVSPAADIHALGILANECFGGRPPRVWGRIIDRATGSIPARRYHDVQTFARAIRRRHWRRNAAIACATALMAAAAMWTASATRPRESALVEAKAWEGLCTDVVTSQVTRIVTGASVATTNEVGHGRYVVRQIGYDVREVTNEVPATVVHLGGRTNVFARPIRLAAGRNYWIVGPGVLEAALVGPSAADYVADRSMRQERAMHARVEKDVETCREYHIFGLRPGDVVDLGPTNGTMHLVDCTLRNLSADDWPSNGLYYRLSGKARLELPNIDGGRIRGRQEFVESED